MTTRRPAALLREAFAPGDPVSLEEAAMVLGGDRQRASSALTYLADNGYFNKIRKQLWMRAGLPCDPYRVGARVTTPYAFVYASALALHGVAASMRTQILIASPHRFDTFEYDGVLYRRAMPWPQDGVTKVSVGPEFVWATTQERTLVDCVRIPANVGGMDELLRSVSALRASLDPKKLLHWVDFYQEANLAARLGFILEWANITSDPDLFDRLEAQRPSSRIYLEPDQRGGQLSRRWNVIVPDRIHMRTTGEDE